MDIAGGLYSQKIRLDVTHELQKRIPNITQKMLTATLRQLESNGLIKRKVYPTVPPKVEYKLTDLDLNLSYY